MEKSGTLNIRADARYDIVTVSSMGVRLTPANRQPVEAGGPFELQSTSAETNVLNVSASLGRRTLVLTRFVEGSAIASYIKGELRKRNIEYTGPEIPQGGPWGYRHQFNIADSGFGLRGPVVQNDRAGEVGRTIDAADYDLKQIFETDGAKILHLSGLIAAMSESTTKACLEVARYAKACGTLISFDLNYRASFWKGREAELRRDFREIAGLADILIGNEEDFQLALGIPGPEAGGEGLVAKIDSFKEMICRVKGQFPHASLFAATLRQVLSANAHLWGGIVNAGDDWFVEEPREIPVLDRIGGGDGFVGGLLYALLTGRDPENALKYGWAAGALAVTVLTDYASPVSESQLENIYRGNARVKR
ncbi:MAG: sugar kinase [Clostridia bacterium]|nr:sugar kinase [Clostridia bacterium]